MPSLPLQLCPVLHSQLLPCSNYARDARWRPGSGKRAARVEATVVEDRWYQGDRGHRAKEGKRSEHGTFLPSTHTGARFLTAAFANTVTVTSTPCPRRPLAPLPLVGAATAVPSFAPAAGAADGFDADALPPPEALDDGAATPAGAPPLPPPAANTASVSAVVVFRAPAPLDSICTTTRQQHCRLPHRHAHAPAPRLGLRRQAGPGGTS